jgi:hypothetical protein
LRNKLSNTSIIKTSINSTSTTRKPIKSGIMYIFLIYYILCMNINFLYRIFEKKFQNLQNLF